MDTPYVSHHHCPEQSQLWGMINGVLNFKDMWYSKSAMVIIEWKARHWTDLGSRWQSGDHGPMTPSVWLGLKPAINDLRSFSVTGMMGMRISPVDGLEL